MPGNTRAPTIYMHISQKVRSDTHYMYKGCVWHRHHVVLMLCLMPAEPKIQEMKPKLQETTNGLRLENVKKTRAMMMMENKNTHLLTPDEHRVSKARQHTPNAKTRD